MTNAMIVMMNSVKLMEEGTIKGSGIFGTIEDGEGNKKEIELPETIHTYAHWKSLGYQVKKGEKAVAKFQVWKYAKGKKQDDNEDGEGKPYMFLKMAAFFTMDQCEAVSK